MIKKILFLTYVLSTLGVSTQSSAALFDDKEARKKILSIETEMIETNAELKANIKELRANQQSLEAVVKGQGLTDMLNQIAVMNAEIARLKGDLELAMHQINEMQQREKDLYVDIDERIRKLEEQNAATPDVAAAANAEVEMSDEALHYKGAKELIDAGQYQDAFTAFDNFIKSYPDSVQLASATYLLGYSQYALKNYKSAIATQQSVIEKFPNSPEVPDAMMNIANAEIQLGRVKSAQLTLKSLISQYPDSEQVPTAKERLKVLSAIR